MPSGRATSQQRKNKKDVPLPKAPGEGKFSDHLLAKDFLLRVSAFPASYLSRRITSPWPTSWSFSHRRHLYVSALLPGRGRPPSNPMAARALKTLYQKGHPVTSDSSPH